MIKCIVCCLSLVLSFAQAQEKTVCYPLSGIAYVVHSDSCTQPLATGFTGRDGEWKFYLIKNAVYTITFRIPDSITTDVIDSAGRELLQLRYRLTTTLSSYEKMLTNSLSARGAYSDAFYQTTRDSIHYSGQLFLYRADTTDARHDAISLVSNEEVKQGEDSTELTKNLPGTEVVPNQNKEVESVVAATLEQTEEQERTLWLNFGSDLGLTFSSKSQENADEKYLEWVLNIQTEGHLLAQDFLLDGKIICLLGQIHALGSLPAVTQNNLTVSLMPSVKIISAPSLRIFYQFLAETFIKEGLVNERRIKMFDPAFVTHTLFVGEKSYPLARSDNEVIELVYGVGYAFTHVIMRDFEATAVYEIQNNNADKGLSAVLNVSIKKEFSTDLSVNLDFSSNALAQKDFFSDVSNSRVSTILLAGLNYKSISLTYNNKILYERMLSIKRILEQSLVLGIKIDI